MGRTSDFNPATTVALHDVLFFCLSPPGQGDNNERILRLLIFILFLAQVKQFSNGAVNYFSVNNFIF